MMEVRLMKWVALCGASVMSPVLSLCPKQLTPACQFLDISQVIKPEHMVLRSIM
jgi:hypothetical protein